ncbi:hypothetical protein EVJ58_g7499, partial [Rhodofomes roseus]
GEGWLECAADEPPEAAGPGPTEAGDERARDPPAEPRTDSPRQSITQHLADAVHTLEGSTAQGPDIEMQAVGAGLNAAPDVPGVTDTAPPAVPGSGTMLEVATTHDESESPQGPDAAQIESVHPLEDTEPHADESDDARVIAEAGTSAGEGHLGGLAGAIERADERQGCDAHSSLEGGGAPGDVPTQPSESHHGQNQNTG